MSSTSTISPKKAIKTLQFIVTVEGVPDNLTRAEVKETIEHAVQTELGPFVKSTHVVRYNLPVQLRRAKTLQKAAKDLMAKVIDPQKALEIFQGKRNGNEHDD